MLVSFFLTRTFRIFTSAVASLTFWLIWFIWVVRVVTSDDRAHLARSLWTAVSLVWIASIALLSPADAARASSFVWRASIAACWRAMFAWAAFNSAKAPSSLPSPRRFFKAVMSPVRVAIAVAISSLVAALSIAAIWVSRAVTRPARAVTVVASALAARAAFSDVVAELRSFVRVLFRDANSVFRALMSSAFLLMSSS